jgi:aspartyl-tRNA(Asn)/glutamyl-tRNA(Gln) amidotransferase subunit A
VSSLAESVAAESFREALAVLHGLPLAAPAAGPPLELRLSAGPARTPSRRTAGAAREVPASPLPERLTDAPTLVDAAAAIRARRLTSLELVETALAAAQANPGLGAIVALDEDDVRRQARELDADRARGVVRGPLHGIPLTVKDVIDVAGLPTGAGSAAYADEPTTDAAGVALLRAAGAVVLAKVATHEFALGVTTPQCRNPYDPERIAGGSSGGSAIAVATGAGLGSLGTDTRASLRVPAALCGVVGFRPTFGRTPVAGIVPLSWTIDTIGPIARTVEDAALLLSVLTGDPSIATATTVPLDRLVVGVAPAMLEETDPDVAVAFEASLAALERLGCSIVELDRPTADDLRVANALGMLVSRCEAAAFHRARGTELELCVPEVRDQLAAGYTVTAMDYLDAQRQRGLLTASVLEVFGSCDVVACPTSPVAAPPRTDYEDYLLRLSRNPILWSLVGAPALSQPCGTTADGLPVALQLAARPGADATLAAVGTALEQELRGWT